MAELPPGSNATSASPTVAVSVPRIFITGPAVGVGVSSVVLGLLAALKKKGTSVAVAKVGSHLIQTTHYRRVTGSLAHSLNLWTLNREQILDTVGRLSSGAEMVILEGDQGLFDRKPKDYVVGVEAEIAQFLNAPIVLVLDAEGFGESIAAAVHGYCHYFRDLSIAGIICNRVRDKAHSEQLKRAIDELKGPIYLGGLPISKDVAASVEAETDENPGLLRRSAVVSAGELVQEHFDFQALKQVFTKSKPVTVKKSVISSQQRACRIAVADDMAFHLTFQSNLDLIRREGGELVAFSPLVDRKLPGNVRGVYLPGGYMQLYATELSANNSMLQALRAFVESGGVLYSEANSVGYLCNSISLQSGTRLSMCGIIPGNATLLAQRVANDTDNLVEVRSVNPTIISRSGERFRGYRDYQWAIRLEQAIDTQFELNFRGDTSGESDMPPVLEGFAPYPNVIATSVQAHWTSNPMLARLFVESVSRA